MIVCISPPFSRGKYTRSWHSAAWIRMWERDGDAGAQAASVAGSTRSMEQAFCWAGGGRSLELAVPLAGASAVTGAGAVTGASAVTDAVAGAAAGVAGSPRDGDHAEQRGQRNGQGDEVGGGEVAQRVQGPGESDDQHRDDD